MNLVSFVQLTRRAVALAKAGVQPYPKFRQNSQNQTEFLLNRFR